VTKSKEGIENFIIRKLEKANTIDEINVSLKSAGFSDSEIEEGISNTKKTHRTLHQDVAAANNFLPTLNKNKGVVKNKKSPSAEDQHAHLGLFAGRLNKKDFTISVLFLFSLFFSVLIIVASFIQAMSPEAWGLLGQLVASDTNNILLLYMPIMFAPFTLIFLSLITRRLHDLELPGIISFLYLGMFVFPSSEYAPIGMFLYDTALFILFIFLMFDSGMSKPNKYGKISVAHGSTFKKILNLN